MLRRPTRPRRRGATIVEYAIVIPTFFMLTFGTVIVGYGVFASNEMASVAREGARWAVVHGGTYVAEYNKSHTPAKTATTDTDVYNNAILPHIAGINTSNLTYTVTWLNSAQMPTYTNGGGQTVPNKVTVTVNYSWTPQLYLSPMTLTGRSTMTMVY